MDEAKNIDYVDPSIVELMDDKLNYERLQGDRIHTKAGSDAKKSLLDRGFRGARGKEDPSDPDTVPGPLKITKITPEASEEK